MFFLVVCWSLNSYNILSLVISWFIINFLLWRGRRRGFHWLIILRSSQLWLIFLFFFFFLGACRAWYGFDAGGLCFLLWRLNRNRYCKRRWRWKRLIQDWHPVDIWADQRWHLTWEQLLLIEQLRVEVFVGRYDDFACIHVKAKSFAVRLYIVFGSLFHLFKCLIRVFVKEQIAVVDAF